MGLVDPNGRTVTAEAPERPATPLYEIHLSCPRCGALLRPVADGTPTESGTTINAIAKCAGRCVRNTEWQLSVRLIPLHQQELHH